ncbi:hypothetical protein GCM10027053_33260 [Intrasporangium mesophilum]
MTEPKTAPHQPRLRIAVLFVSDWSHEFRDVLDGKVPTHRLFGIWELAERGHDVRHLTRPGRRDRSSARWMLAQGLWLLRTQRQIDVIVATHEAAALPALALRRVGLLRRPVVVLTVAALDAVRRGRKGRTYRWALRGADVVTVFASSQREPLAVALGVPSRRVRFVPMGVDVAWFVPSDDLSGGPDVLSVGTNDGKDFPTLVAALDDRLDRTTCVIVTDPANRAAAQRVPGAERVEFRSDVPIVDLRRLYAAARTLVIPLRESSVSSGQTVLLENLAMGNEVIVSDVSGIRDYVAPGVVRLVPPGDIAAMRRALDGIESRDSDDDDAARRRQHVVDRFTTRQLAAAIEELALESALP